MKKITTFLGFVGVVSLISACSDDSSPAKVNDQEQSEVSSSSIAGENPVPSEVSSSSGASPVSSATVTHDTVHTQVEIKLSSGNVSTPYYSSAGPFCWSAECEQQRPSSSSAAPVASSSSFSIEVTMSSEAQVLPTVTETQMIDQRDQQMYSLQRIGGLHWMSQNLNYETKTGSYCKTSSSEDMCATYGRFYSYAGALKACPTGWRLPTQAEVEALDAAVDHEWWSIGGRFKLTGDEATDYGLDEEQGYIWIQAEGEYSSFRVKNYSGDSPHEFQSGSISERAYNVRCVSEQ